MTVLVWFAGGVGLSISNVLSGLHTTPSTRGKAFGFIALAWIKVQDKPDCIPAGKTLQPTSAAHRLGAPYLFLLMTILLAWMTVSVGRIA